ncbi:hypothetical protein [Streptomyces sp. UG1]|uniref:hypothetical protein n=1 Tax=Streptomyces sp. UG1 TaxID=3417652 RepID=UPI003CF8576F
MSRTLCDFDSSVAAVRAVGRFLHGRDFRALGVAPASAPLAALASGLPVPARRRLFVTAGQMQSSPVSRVRRLTGEDLASWTTERYGPGPYPAVFLGSVSGAAVHLAAALRAPVLPQTYLVPVRARLDPDRPRAALAAGLELGRSMLEDNPELALCHMHDPSQDRAMLVRFTYFRFKRLRLGPTLERFLEERLAPGATVFLVDCTLTWPVSVLGDRHFFQFGALGGMPPEEYVSGSDRIAEHLAEQHAAVRRWEAPRADGEYAEAEWGYDDSLTKDVLDLAARRGHPVRRISLAEPEHLSPAVAELYRWWHRRRGLPAQRLLVETYNQWEPYWTLRLGAVPFWLQFTALSSLDLLEHYLEGAEPYERIGVNLFSNGLRSVGQAPVRQWGQVAARYATKSAGTIGVDEHAYPLDFGATMRHRPALSALPERCPLPPPLRLAELDEFLGQLRLPEASPPLAIETIGPTNG